ncbi:MAG: PAS domain S-box protein [Opitutaceae bacterium]|nr:PAS domain S-box protein [Opitutaceae bacterium]
MNVLLALFRLDGLLPHGQSYAWTPSLVGLHAVSDGLIALGSAVVGIVLLRSGRHRRDQPRRRMLTLFGAAFLGLAAAHAVEVATIWQPWHVPAGLTQAVAAGVLLAAAVALVRTCLQPANTSVAPADPVPDPAWRAERDRAEAEISRLNQLLQRRVDELQALFNVLPVGVGIAEDRECRVIRTNDAFARMLGVNREINASLSASTRESPLSFRVLQDDRPLNPDELPMQTCARENRAVADFEETIVRSDGVRIEVLANAVPLHDAQGNVTGCVATFQDVTLLKNALAAHARYAAIVASAQDAIIGKTLEGVITDWNAAAEKIFGYSAVEMIGRSITPLLPEDRREEEEAALARARRGEPAAAFETVRRHKDGRLVEASIVMSPIRAASGRIVGVSVSARDISAQKHAEAERREMDRKLQETQKLDSLGVLAGGIAHDFNNLLTGILGNVSLARSELPADSEIVTYLQQIDVASRRAADLCRQMLAYAGRSLFMIRRLELNPLVSSLQPLLDVSISQHCTLRFDLAPALPPVLADAAQVRQILVNLVTNAAEAIGSRPGIITVATGSARIDRDYLAQLTLEYGIESGRYVFLEVGDNGSGMDPATKERIFEPFFTTKFTGRGLGLAAVLGIVRGHKGALKVYSEPDRGTVIKIYLPCATLDSAPPEAAAVARSAGPAGRVLVVDDEDSVRDVSVRILQSCGFATDVAVDGRAAVELFRAAPSRYDVVLLDLTMPVLDGVEAFRQLRQIQPDVRVVLMSGFNEQDAVGRFTGKGLAGFVQKPFDASALGAAITAALAAR